MPRIKYDEKEPLEEQIRDLIEKDNPKRHHADFIVKCIKKYILDWNGFNESTLISILEGEVKPSTFKKIKKLIEEAFGESYPPKLVICNDPALKTLVESLNDTLNELQCYIDLLDRLTNILKEKG